MDTVLCPFCAIFLIVGLYTHAERQLFNTCGEKILPLSLSVLPTTKDLYQFLLSM